MRVIDLLNKIANGEEVPKKLNIDGWEYDKDYENLEEEIFQRLYYEDFKLNDEVEIIKEHKIPEKIKIDNEDRIQALSTGNYCYKVKQIDKIIIYKINEILDYLEEIE